MRVVSRVSTPRESRRGLVAALLLALGALALVPAAAAGSSARVSGTTIQYTAGAGQSNDVHAEPVAAGSFRLRDSAPLAAGPGCTQTGPSEVTCSATGVDKVSFALGDGDDALAAFDTYIGDQAEARVVANGGEGNDQLVAGVYTNATFDGGSGDDKVIVGDGGGRAAGGAGNDQLEAGVDFDGSLDGGAGNDTFALVGYRQSVTGGPGFDRASYFTYSQCCSPSAVQVSLDGAANDGPQGRDDIGADVESVEGGSGADGLTGNGVANTLTGFGGDDTINGQGGEDNLLGGDGNDRITSRDGAQDSVICGAGTDTVDADLADLVSRDCETVSRPSGTPATGEPTPIASPAPLVAELARTQSAPPRTNTGTTSGTDAGGVLGATSAGVGISRRAATLRGRYLRVRLACPSGARLTGVVTLSNTRSGRKLGSTRFRCASGRTIVVKVALTARTRRTLARSRRARVKVRVVARDGSGEVTRAARIVRLRG